MTTITEPETEEKTDTGDELVHKVCASCIKHKVRPLIAFCGLDCTDDREVPSGDYGALSCVVCEAMVPPTGSWHYCNRCGMWLIYTGDK